ncbi:hypothetical protein RP20_CCG011934 [Aedes albopictus]|nr:hypothetical protein RP20_CCG011934 [Aedes albopictus]
MFCDAVCIHIVAKKVMVDSVRDSVPESFVIAHNSRLESIRKTYDAESWPSS